MSVREHSAAGHPEHPEHPVAGHEEHHPGPRQYVMIGVILFVLTVVEVAVVYIEALGAFLLPILMVLMVIKFALVVLYFMHLKFDNKLFSTLFTAPLLIAVSIVLALIALFNYRTLQAMIMAGGSATGTGGGH